ncbi:CHRD domain-containing protein [Arthrobacter rhizosphaerae]|uniref:CHRD domain-containing protein n=1 Tax=Arthrobacter rhizosphaerae TaxID=2855490 RepID=UPI001FF0FFAA|nr:CHRD domain-containing protein [Arthrobacter rhizosphaerae]
MLNAHPARFRAMAVLAAVTALATANTGPATAAPGGGGAAIPLNVGQETTGSDTGAHGFFSYDIVNGEFCYTLSVEDLSAPVAAAHIHVGARKVAGPIVIPLEIGTGTTWTETACVPADATVLAALEADPRAYYVNVHTPTFPGGEIRGQLK